MKNWFGILFVSIAMPVFSQTVGTLPGELSIDQGVAYYQIPLNLPEGKGGIKPDLALSYSSTGNVKSSLGAGFTLNGLSSIQRCGNHSFIDGNSSSVTYSVTDNFCIDGSRLIPAKGVAGKDNSGYVLFSDDQSEYILHGDSDTDSSYFVKHEKSGAIKEYRYNKLLKNWLLNIEQNHPQSEKITYQFDDLGYIKSVQYDLFSVHFIYESIKNVIPVKQFKIDGNIYKQDKNLVRVDVNVNDELKNYYQLSYKAQSLQQEVSTTFLEEVKYCDNNNICLPATRFKWDETAPPTENESYFGDVVAQVDFSHWGKTDIPENWGNSSRSWWVDIDGNNVGDFCKTDSKGLICHIDVATSQVSRTYSIDKWGDEKSHWWVDINNDGRTDFCRIDNDQLYCDSFNKDNTTTQKVWPLTIAGMKNFRWWKDMDGNGKPEYCRRTGDELLCSEPQESGSWAETLHVYNIEWSEPDDTYWIDVNGDGSSDLCSTVGKTIKCTTFSGQNLLKRNARFAISSVGKSDTRWWIDVNGDGASDFCRMTKNEAGQEVNLTCSLGSLGEANQFSDDIELIKGQDWTGELGSADKRWWIDLDQDGTTDFCRGVGNKIQCVNINKHKYSFNVNSWGSGFNAFMDLNQDGIIELCKKKSSRLECQTAKKNNYGTLLLQQVTNGLGHTSSVWFGPYNKHTPQDTFDADDTGLKNLSASYPVAYRLETDNGKGKNNYLFWFGPAKRSRDGMQQSGFSWISQRNFVNGVNTSNSESYFYTDFPYSGLLKKQVNYSGNGQKFVENCTNCNDEDFWNFRTLAKSSQSETTYQSLSQKHQAVKIKQNRQQLITAATAYLTGYKVLEYKDKKYAAHADQFVPVGASPMMPIMIPSKTFYLVQEQSSELDDSIPVWSLSPVSDALNHELAAISYSAQYTKAITSEKYAELVDTEEVLVSHNSFATYPSDRKDIQFSEQGDVLSTVEIVQKNVDQYLNVGKIVTTTTGLNPTTGHDETFVEITENQYLNNTSNWLIGLLNTTTTTYTHSDGSSVTKNASFKYDDVTGLLTEHTTFPGTSYAVITRKQRDPNGTVIRESVTATNGSKSETRTTTFKHTYTGNLVQTETTNPLGHVTSLTTNLLTGVITKIDGNGLKATTKSDGFGREIEISVANSSVRSQISRYPADDGRCLFNVKNATYCIVNASQGSGKKVSFYDFLEREVRKATLSVNNKWVFVDSDYDAFGNLVSVSKPYYQGDIPQYIVTKYDTLGRVTSISEPGPAGQEPNWISYVYSPFSVAKTDAKGRVSRIFNNVMGWEIKKQEPSGGEIRYEFYANGLLKSATTSHGDTVRTEYNIQGNKSSVSDPDLGLWTYNYDGFGQLISRTDAKGQRTDFIYDKLGRKVAETVQTNVDKDGKTEKLVTNKTWTFDQTDGRQWLGALLKTTVEGQVIKNFFYNDLGLLRREETITQNHTFARDLEYNTKGQLTKEVRPEQFVVNYERDAATGMNTEVWGDISQAQVNFTPEEYRNVIEPLIKEALNKAKDYIASVKELRAQQYFYNQRKEEYQALKDQLISFDGQAENEAFAQKMMSELYTRPLEVYTDAQGERYFKVSPRTVLISQSNMIPVIQQPDFHLKIEGNLLRKVSLEEWASIENELVKQNQVAYYGNYSRDGGMSLATFDLERDDPLYDQRIRQMFTELNSMAGEVDRLEYVNSLTEKRVDSYLAAAEQLVTLVKQVKLVAQKYQSLANESETESEALSTLKDDNADTGRVTYWKLNAIDAEGRAISEVLGNGLVNSYDYHEGNGQLLNIYTRQGSKLIRNIHYTYDRMDNVHSRRDQVNHIQEDLYYDDQDRLTDYQLSGLDNAHSDNPLFNKKYSVSYAANGNITYKSDAGHYIYSDPIHKHAVTKVGDNSYAYDANGNITSGGGRTISWTGFNKPTRIQEGASWVSFQYDESNDHFMKQSSDGSTSWYLGQLYERKELASGDIQHKQYIYAGGGLVAVNINTVKSDGQGNYASIDRQIRYPHADALKSVDMVTDMWGNVVDRKLYDPWGKVRPFSWQSDNDELMQSVLVDRGFTGHEMLDEVSLIHMNGRLYDANLARFISADVYIQAPESSQSFNRYSYVLNNPLKYNDPSGHFSNRITRELRRQGRDIRKFTERYTREIVGVVVGIVATVYSGGLYAVMLSESGSGYFAAGSLTNAVVSGALGGATGGAASGGIISRSWTGIAKGATVGAITGAVGGYNGFHPTKGVFHAAHKVAMSALGGCATGEIVGSSCEKGAKFAALSQVVVLSVEYMKNITVRYKLRSCATPGTNSICQRDIDGELLTDGTRGSQPMWTEKPSQTWFTTSGMAKEASGQHWYDQNGLIGRFINRVSKVHDYFNSDVSRLFGFQGYDQVTGMWLEGSTFYNHAFQLYSFMGMLPAGIYTGAALAAPYPVYPYSQLGDN